MKILHILNTDRYSGAENVAITIIKKMQNENEIVYVSLDGPIREYLTENGIDFEPIKQISIREMRRVIKKYKPDIIHAHDFTASVICAIVCGKSNLISHIHKNATWLKKVNMYSVLYLLTSVKYKNILAVSESIIKEYIFKKSIYKKTKVIGNPVDIQDVINKSEQYKEKENSDIIYIGRLSEEKNPIKFIEVIKRASFKNYIKAIMIGDGKLKDECLRAINKEKLEEIIEVKGFLKNPYPILKNSKILCMTSKYEGYGLVAIEALSLGKPVVATKVGGIPSIVDSNCGMVTNSTDLMVKEIQELLNNKDYYNKKSINAIKKAQEINNIDSYIQNLKSIYNKCLGDKICYFI